MDEQVIHEIVDEVLSSLEPLDTQASAILEFLKAKGIASEEDLAPFLEHAGNASNVRWLAARVRIKSLISSAMKTEGPKPADPQPEAKSAEDEDKDSQSREESTQPKEKAAAESEAKQEASEAPQIGPDAGTDKNPNASPQPENSAPVASPATDNQETSKPSKSDTETKSEPPSNKEAA